MVRQRLTDDEVIGAMKDDTSLNRARRIFSSSSARMDQASAQAKPIGPVERRRLEFEAVAKIVRELGLDLDLKTGALSLISQAQAGTSEDRRAYQVLLKAGSGCIFRDLGRAFESIGHSVQPGRGVTLAEAEERFSMLHAQGLSGNLTHWIRFRANEEDLEASILVHDLEAKPSEITERDAYNLDSDLDPTYVLQSALYETEESSDAIDDDALYNIEVRVASALKRDKRFTESDDEFAERVRRHVREIGNPDLLPEILDGSVPMTSWPGLVRNRFFELCQRVFPEDALQSEP